MDMQVQKNVVQDEAVLQRIKVSKTEGVELASLGEVGAFADLMERAGLLPKGTNRLTAIISIVAGRPLGLNPFQAVQGIAVINGRPSLWGDAMIAVVKASGLVEDEGWERIGGKNDDTAGFRYVVKRKGVPTPYTATFTVGDAKRAGLWGRDVWKAYPERMLKNRCRAFALRDGFDDVLRGCSSAEEMRDVEIAAEPTAQEVAKESILKAITEAEKSAPPVVVDLPPVKAKEPVRAAAKKAAPEPEPEPEMYEEPEPELTPEDYDAR